MSFDSDAMSRRNLIRLGGLIGGAAYSGSLLAPSVGQAGEEAQNPLEFLQPQLHLYQGQILVENEADKTEAYDSTLYGPTSGTVRALLANSKSIIKNSVLYAKMPKESCFPEHYHKHWELIFVISGKLDIWIKDSNSPESKAQSAEDKIIQYSISLNSGVKNAHLQEDYQHFLIEEDGWINIPGYCLHGIDTPENSKIIAYLPISPRFGKNYDSCKAGFKK